MKRTLTLIAAIGCLATAQAQDYNYLVLRLLDTSEQTMTTEGLVMTFADGQLTATSGGTTTTLALSQLDAMYFSQEDINGIGAQQQTPTTLRVNGRTLLVSAPAGSQVLIAGVGGMLVDHYTAGNDAQPTSLRPGIYVVKVNDKSTKIIIK